MIVPAWRGQPRATALGVLVLALIGGALLVGAQDDEDKPPSPAEVKAKKDEVYRQFAGADTEWTRMGKPQPGEWLARFPEPGQTFSEYREAMEADRPGPAARILIVPLGDFAKDNSDLLKVMAEYGEVFFSTKTEVAAPRPFPKNAWTKSRSQYNADKLLNVLGKEVPEACIAYIGFTDQDLYSPGLNFVFGEGTAEKKVGVYSTHRLGDPPALLLRRTLQLMNHEIGHIFGIDHCIFYDCSMDGANSLEEGDRHPTHYCPLDEKKLAWFFGFDPAKHYRRLAEFYRKHGLAPEAAFLDRVLARMEK